MRLLLVLLAVAIATTGARAAEAPADVGVDEHLGESVPFELELTRADGRAVRFGSLFEDGKPVVLILAYDRCPMLCGLVMRSATEAFRAIDWKLGADFRAVNVSFDPKDRPADAARRQAIALERVGAPGAAAAWPFFVGDEPEVRALAGRVGFRYRYVPETRDFAHPAAIVVLTPEGRISRYLYGIDVRPKDLKLALVEAAAGRSGSSFDRFILRCYRYDPASRRYELAIKTYIRAGALVILLTLGTMLVRLWRRP